MTVDTAAQALALVKRAGLITLASRIEGVPCFVEEVVGQPVRGSWWGHPKGKLIFSLAEGLEDSGEVITLKLISGATTFMHRKLWPVFLGVVLDDGWRRARSKTLSAAAKALWKKVELATRRGEAPAPVKALEASLLVHVTSEHTERGRHEKRLTSWAHWAKAQAVSPTKLTLDAAREELKRTARGAPMALES